MAASDILSGNPCVALFCDRVGWHSRQLSSALKRQGLSCRLVDMSQCSLDTSGPDGILLPGFESQLPQAAIVRGIPAGSFEQVTLRLGILHALARSGVPTINSAHAIERSVDKSATSQILRRTGLPTPRSLATDRRAHAAQWLAREIAAGHAVVMKPLFGAEGKGLRLLSSQDTLPLADTVGGVWYLQRFLRSEVGRGARDIRLLVVGDQVPFAMQRQQTDDWVTNVARGGRCLAFEPNREQRAMALAAAQAVGADIAGVDLLIDLHGKAWVLEVNSVPAWSGLQSVSSDSIADVIARQVVARMKAAHAD